MNNEDLLKNKNNGSSRRGTVQTNPARNHEVASLIPGLAQWVKDPRVAMSCGVGCRCSSDLVSLRLWCRPAAAALKRRKQTKKSTSIREESGHGI